MGVCFFVMAISQSMVRVKVLKPYGSKEEAVYAGFWLRVGSGLADTIFRFVVFILIFFVLAQISANEIGQSLSLLVYLSIELFTLKALGQTPGDMLMGIQVVKLDLSKITWVEVVLRMFVRILSVLGAVLTTYLLIKGNITYTDLVAHSPSKGFVYKNFVDRLSLLGRIWAVSEFFVLMTNRKKRAFQDLMAGTAVIMSPVQERSKPVWKGGFLALVTAIVIVFVRFWSVPIMRAESDKGDPRSQKVLADLYLRGWMVPQDYGQALQWYQKSAALGDADAQERIGEFYENGLGLSKDQSQAIKCYTQAAQNGNWTARAKLKKLGVAYPSSDQKP